MPPPYFPPTLPANTVVGRLGIGPGPAEAIPLTTIIEAAVEAALGGIRDVAFINVADHADIVGDGVTDNLLPWTVWMEAGKTLGTPTFPVTVTISIGNPAVVTWANHFLRVNEAVVFSTTGSLPTGITAGTVYYVISSGMTENTFSISTTNCYISGAGTLAYDFLVGEGAPVQTSGSQSGVHKISLLGVITQNILIPPGRYYNPSGGLPISNQRRAIFNCYGVVVDLLNFNAFNLGVSNFLERNVWAYINTVVAAATTITVTTLADALKFVPNQWLCIGALDLQSIFGSSNNYPPNNHYVEYRKIVSINTGTGVITLNEPLRNTYKSTYPAFFGGTAATGHSSGVVAYGGKAIIWGMNMDWDHDIEIRGIEFADNPFQETVSSGRNVTWRDCVINGANGFTPTVNKFFRVENCRCPPGPANGGMRFEIDKLVEEVVIRDCDFPEGDLLVQSSSPNMLLIENTSIRQMRGTAKNTEIHSCDIASLTVGPLLYGPAESLTIVNSRIGFFGRSMQLTDQLVSNSNAQNCIHNFEFVDGIFKEPIAQTQANYWAVPGRTMYINDMLGAHVSMGSPFQVLDVYLDGSDFCVATTLFAIPAATTTSSVVTITIATPGVVSWAAHGLANGTPIVLETTGALPTGLTPLGVVYYVVAAGVNDFKLALTVGGAAINTTGSQSGVHTAFSNPLHISTLACPKVTVTNCTGCAAIEDMSNGPANVPLFSYAKRRIVGLLETSTSFILPITIIGTLVSMTINVRRAYTGATTPYTLTFTGNAFNTSLVAANLSLVIDLTIAGIRTITPAAATGSVGVDSIAAFGNWLAGDGIYFVASASVGDPLSEQPIIEVEITTDQGVAKPSLIDSFTPNNAHTEVIASTTPRVQQ